MDERVFPGFRSQSTYAGGMDLASGLLLIGLLFVRAEVSVKSMKTKAREEIVLTVGKMIWGALLDTLDDTLIFFKDSYEFVKDRLKETSSYEQWRLIVNNRNFILSVPPLYSLFSV